MAFIDVRITTLNNDGLAEAPPVNISIGTDDPVSDLLFALAAEFEDLSSIPEGWTCKIERVSR